MWTRFTLVLDAHDRMLQRNPGKSEDERAVDLVESLDGLLDALFEYTEDCTGILRSFFAPDVAFKKDPRVRRYEKRTSPYRNFIAHRVNHLKHNHGRLRLVTVRVAEERYYAYFIEGLHPNGAVGAHPELHRSTPAYSFARDLRFHFLNVYAHADVLSATVDELASPTGDPIGGAADAVEARVTELLSRISQLPRICLPGEGKLAWPEVSLQADGDSAEAELRMLSPVPPSVRRVDDFEVSVSFESDGTPGQRFQLPFPFRRKP